MTMKSIASYPSSRRCGPRPGDQLRRVLDHVDGHLVIVPQRLAGSRPEWLHTAVDIRLAGDGVGLEVEPAVEDDREEAVAVVDPVAAEHRAPVEAAETAELIEHELLVVVVLHRDSTTANRRATSRLPTVSRAQ